MILVDTTVWIDFFRKKQSQQVDLFKAALENYQEIFICGVVLTEILQGICDNKEYRRILIALEPFTYIEITRKTYMNAADIYRKLRGKGFTVRKTIDYLISACALENNLFLLHNDKDFLPIVEYCGLKVLC